MKQSLMPGFKSKNGHLMMDDVDVCNLAETYGTPLLVISKDGIKENIRNIRKNASLLFEPFELKYAVKANPNPAILSIIRDEGLGIDASSENEVKLALKVGFPAERILFTPNYASMGELRSASDMGIAINFDSLNQMNAVLDHLPDTVSFRIKIEYGRGEFKGTTTAGRDAKFGVTVEEAIRGYRLAKEKGVTRFGIHVMAGSNVLDPSHFALVTENILESALRIREGSGIDFDFIDLGGGLGVPYLPDQKELDLHEVFSNVHKAFRKFYKEKEQPVLVLEPGRYIVANACILIGRVTDVKFQEKAYVGSDVSMNTLIRPALYGARHHMVLANRTEDPVGGEFEVVGQVCENTDRLGSKVNLPVPSENDLLCIFNAGAYVSSMASNYNGRPVPAEVLIDDGSARLTRKRSGFSDYVANYIFP